MTMDMGSERPMHTECQTIYSVWTWVQCVTPAPAQHSTRTSCLLALVRRHCKAFHTHSLEHSLLNSMFYLCRSSCGVPSTLNYYSIRALQHSSVTRFLFTPQGTKTHTGKNGIDSESESEWNAREPYIQNIT